MMNDDERCEEDKKGKSLQEGREVGGVGEKKEFSVRRSSRGEVMDL